IGRTPRPRPFPYTTLFRSSGELTTPTGAALVRMLSQGAPPPFVPLRSGFGAGTRDPEGRVNALRLILAEPGATATDGSTVQDLVDRKSTRLNSSHVKTSYA